MVPIVSEVKRAAGSRVRLGTSIQNRRNRMLRLSIRLLFGSLYAALSAVVVLIAFTAWFSDGGSLWERVILSPGVPVATWAVLAAIGFETFYRALRPWILAWLGLTFLGLAGIGGAMASGAVRGDYTLVAALALIPVVGVAYLEWVRPRLGLDRGWSEMRSRVSLPH